MTFFSFLSKWSPHFGAISSGESAEKKPILDHTLVDPLTKGSDATAGRTVHVPSAPWVKLISDGEMVR